MNTNKKIKFLLLPALLLFFLWPLAKPVLATICCDPPKYYEPTTNKCITHPDIQSLTNCGLFACDTVTNTCLSITQAPITSSYSPDCTLPNDKKGINTALGCISTDVTGDFFSNLITIFIGLGGGLALLLILIGTAIITTSSGIPERIQAGQKIITSAISGLLFIILSVFIMNLIGVKILSLPGL